MVFSRYKIEYSREYAFKNSSQITPQEGNYGGLSSRSISSLIHEKGFFAIVAGELNSEKLVNFKLIDDQSEILEGFDSVLRSNDPQTNLYASKDTGTVTGAVDHILVNSNDVDAGFFKINTFVKKLVFKNQHLFKTDANGNFLKLNGQKIKADYLDFPAEDRQFLTRNGLPLSDHYGVEQTFQIIPQ